MEEEETEIAKVANLNGKGGGKQGLQVSEKETKRERGVLLVFFFFFFFFSYPQGRYSQNFHFLGGY